MGDCLEVITSVQISDDSLVGYHAVQGCMLILLFCPVL